MNTQQRSNTGRTVTRFQIQALVAGLVLAGAAGLAWSSPGTGMGTGMGMGGSHGMMAGGGMGPMGDGAMGGGQMGDRKGHGRQGAGMERMLEEVGATPEQRAQVRQIWDAARKDMQAMRQGGMGTHQEMARLLAQPNIDANAVEALRQQQSAMREQASKRMTQAMLEASQVLTPEQRAKVAERMAQRQAMMLQHRAERGQMSGAPRN